MKATVNWLDQSRDLFTPDTARTGVAHLANYSAEYCEWGNGPPLVLVPGLAGGIELLGPLARILAENFRVISYQLRGETDCFALRRRFGLNDLINDLAEFIALQRLECPAVMGVSFGGILALEYAVRHPSRLDKLVVQGVGSRFERGFLQRIAGLVLSRYPLPTNNPFVNQFFNLLFGGRQDPGPLFQFVTSQCWQTDQSVMAHRFHLVERYDMTAKLEQIRVPTLILSGERDLLVSERSLKRLSQGIPKNRVVTIPAAGHLAFLTEPERVAAEVEQFLRR